MSNSLVMKAQEFAGELLEMVRQRDMNPAVVVPAFLVLAARITAAVGPRDSLQSMIDLLTMSYNEQLEKQEKS